MKTKKVTVTLSEEDLATLRRAGSVTVHLPTDSILKCLEVGKASENLGPLEVIPSTGLPENGAIGYDLAKMAKKAGYPQLCYPWDNSMGYYDGNGKLSPYLCVDEGSCLCCSQSQLQQWIRRKYKIHIQINFTEDGWQCRICGIDNLSSHYLISSCFYTYERALEETLYRILELIIADQERIKTKK